MAISVETPVVAFAFGLGDKPRPAAAGVEVFDKNFGIKPFSVLGPDGMGLKLGDDLLGQQFHNSKILETARNARTAMETKPPCANEDKSSSLGFFAQGGYLAGPGGGDEASYLLPPLFYIWIWICWRNSRFHLQFIQCALSIS